MINKCDKNKYAGIFIFLKHFKTIISERERERERGIELNKCLYMWYFCQIIDTYISLTSLDKALKTVAFRFTHTSKLDTNTVYFAYGRLVSI